MGTQPHVLGNSFSQKTDLSLCSRQFDRDLFFWGGESDVGGGRGRNWVFFSTVGPIYPAMITIAINGHFAQNSICSRSDKCRKMKNVQKNGEAYNGIAKLN